jgi:hypothetical protein
MALSGCVETLCRTGDEVVSMLVVSGLASSSLLERDTSQTYL